MKWLPIQYAPRDGTIIEIKNTYGVAPWYGLFRWTDEIDLPSGAGKARLCGEKAWRSYPDSLSAISSEDHIQWRPYNGDVDNYVDPTGGAQFTGKYWRQAAAVKLGRHPDFFEPKKSLVTRIKELFTL